MSNWPKDKRYKIYASGKFWRFIGYADFGSERIYESECGIVGSSETLHKCKDAKIRIESTKEPLLQVNINREWPFITIS